MGCQAPNYKTIKTKIGDIILPSNCSNYEVNNYYEYLPKVVAASIDTFLVKYMDTYKATVDQNATKMPLELVAGLDFESLRIQERNNRERLVGTTGWWRCIQPTRE